MTNLTARDEFLVVTFSYKQMEHLPVLQQSVHETGIHPGQLYAAKRNGPPLILTCEARMGELVAAREVPWAFSPSECFLIKDDADPREVSSLKALLHFGFSEWAAAEIGRTF